MIATRIVGGLGNQMFQYAFGFALAKRHGVPLYLDCSAFETYRLHRYDLDHLRISAPRLSGEQRRLAPVRYGGSRIARLLGDDLRHVREKPFGFDPRYLDSGSHSYLDGYWQSEQFFAGVRDELLAEFDLRHPPSDASRRLAEQIRGTPSVSVHIRRGDYASDRRTLSIHGLCPLDYYRNCIDDLARQLPSLRVFLFTNDHAWCRESLRLPYPVVHVDHNDHRTAHEDLWLMSRCDHNVVANSTFSWWGAWMNQNPSRRIYAPLQWFQDPTMDGSQVVPPHWHRISARPAERREVG